MLAVQMPLMLWEIIHELKKLAIYHCNNIYTYLTPLYAFKLQYIYWTGFADNQPKNFMFAW